MPTKIDRAPSTPTRRPAADIIDAIVQTMQEQLERLKYSTLAPSRYLVYLHPTEHARLEGIAPLLRDEAVRALDEAVGRINRRHAFARYRDRLLGRAMPPVQHPASGWQIEFLPDADDAVEEGAILVDAELLLPSGPEPAAGNATRRLKTLYQRPRLATTQQLTTAASGPSGGQSRPLAHVSYQDDNGTHTYEIVKDSVTIGRGGAEYPVDIRVASSPDVSREHARIRRDPATGRFFLIDLSTLGTTLNGRHVPAGYEHTDGGKRENHSETALPERARIGLAETVFLEFRQNPPR